MGPAGERLTEIDILIGTGGALVFADDASSLLRAGLSWRTPYTLPPPASTHARSELYLYAIGLLAEEYPETAEALLKRH